MSVKLCMYMYACVYVFMNGCVCVCVCVYICAGVYNRHTQPSLFLTLDRTSRPDRAGQF